MFIIKQFQKRNIYISRKHHPNDGTLALRISAELAKQGQGILHIGGHEGQEAPFYSDLNLPVIWVEALPEKYELLASRIKLYPKQRAICFLLGEKNKPGVTFYLSDNNAASSSIFRPKIGYQHSFSMVEQLTLDMKRLDSVISVSDAKNHRHWVIDVQGAELDVLRGSGKLINFCNSIMVEAKRDSFYQGGTDWDNLVNFLCKNGFVPLWQIGEHDEDNAFFVRVEKRVT